ncbi:MAG: ATP-binding protein [Chloroflexota bacterium]
MTQALPPTPGSTGSPTGATGMPLAVRLGLVLSAAVLVVLLLTGAVVNRVVIRSFDDVVTAQQQDQVDATADALGELLRQGGTLREARSVLLRLSRSMHGPVTVYGPEGREITHFGDQMLPAGETRGLDAPVVVADQEVAMISVIVAAQNPEQPFLRLFNQALVISGLVSLVVIAGLAVWIARRQTRPLRDVTAAASRLEGGDLSARATGGGDRESQELAGAFNTMATRLERTEMLRRRAATDMAHDLATPATVLEGQLQAMIDGVVPKNLANLEAARASASALGSVIVQLGELASAEAAPLQARPERVEVAAILAEAASALDGLYRERGVKVEVQPVAPELAAWADTAHLGRALRNVMTNAAQHTASGRSVRVTATAAGEAGDRVQIRVIDQGPGIPPEDLPHIFERFYRSDPARAIQPATQPGAGPRAGIGLTIARELLAPSGGAISVETTGPDGSTLLMDLPARA